MNGEGRREVSRDTMKKLDALSSYERARANLKVFDANFPKFAKVIKKELERSPGVYIVDEVYHKPFDLALMPGAQHEIRAKAIVQTTLFKERMDFGVGIIDLLDGTFVTYRARDRDVIESTIAPWDYAALARMGVSISRLAGKLLLKGAGRLLARESGSVASKAEKMLAREGVGKGVAGKIEKDLAMSVHSSVREPSETLSDFSQSTIDYLGEDAARKAASMGITEKSFKAGIDRFSMYEFFKVDANWARWGAHSNEAVKAATKKQINDVYSVLGPERARNVTAYAHIDEIDEGIDSLMQKGYSKKLIRNAFDDEIKLFNHLKKLQVGSPEERTEAAIAAMNAAELDVRQAIGVQRFYKIWLEWNRNHFNLPPDRLTKAFRKLVKKTDKQTEREIRRTLKDSPLQRLERDRAFKADFPLIARARDLIQKAPGASAPFRLRAGDLPRKADKEKRIAAEEVSPKERMSRPERPIKVYGKLRIAETENQSKPPREKPLEKAEKLRIRRTGFPTKELAETTEKKAMDTTRKPRIAETLKRKSTKESGFQRNPQLEKSLSKVKEKIETFRQILDQMVLVDKGLTTLAVEGNRDLAEQIYKIGFDPIKTAEILSFGIAPGMLSRTIKNNMVEGFTPEEIGRIVNVNWKLLQVLNRVCKGNKDMAKSALKKNSFMIDEAIVNVLSTTMLREYQYGVRLETGNPKFEPRLITRTDVYSSVRKAVKYWEKELLKGEKLQNKDIPSVRSLGDSRPMPKEKLRISDRQGLTREFTRPRTERDRTPLRPRIETTLTKEKQKHPTERPLM